MGDQVSVGSEKKTVLKVTVERRFREADGSWKSSGSFSRNEVPLVIYCLEKAFERMLQKPAEDGAEADDQSD